jgi:REP element-mobilizing transposase RayT
MQPTKSNPAAEIVRRQRMNSGDVSPGARLSESPKASPSSFLGWHERGYLPHYDAPGEIQFVTWRQADSLPAQVLGEMHAFAASGRKRQSRVLAERSLDAGFGSCRLRDPEAALVVETALRHFDGTRYRLCAWCVMPNHVHVLFETFTTPMRELVESWKKFTALQFNRAAGIEGAFWQADYWDTYIRDEGHFWRTVRYVEDNPVSGGLVRQPEEWPWSSAHPQWRWTDAPGTSRWHGARLNGPPTQ